MNRPVGAFARIACILSLLVALSGLSGLARAGQEPAVWEFVGGRLAIEGPRKLAIIDDRGSRTELELDGDLAAVYPNPAHGVALVLIRDGAAYAQAVAELGFEPDFFACDALLLMVPGGRWLAFPVTGNANKPDSNACGPHLAAAFSPDGKYTLLADYMQVAVTEQLVAALTPTVGLRRPAAPKNKPIEFERPACGGVVDFASFRWVDDETLTFDYGACGILFRIEFNADRGKSRVLCDPARQKEGYACPQGMPAE